MSCIYVYLTSRCEVEQMCNQARKLLLVAVAIRRPVMGQDLGKQKFLFCLVVVSKPNSSLVLQPHAVYFGDLGSSIGEDADWRPSTLTKEQCGIDRICVNIGQQCQN